MAKEQTCSTCSDQSCKAKEQQAGESDKDFMERQKMAMRMCKIKHKVIVMSGKGGVGKSTVAVNLAISLAVRGAKVGIVDIDIHGPSVPKLLDLEAYAPHGDPDGISPALYTVDHKPIRVMSIGFFLRQADSAVIWRGPMKMSAIRQFLTDVEWGELDYLVIDSPPGTGDEPLSICQLIEGIDGAVVVTTPQALAILDVKKSIAFCSQMNLPVFGVVENMSGMICPKCGEQIGYPSGGAGRKMASDMNVPFLGRIPIDLDVMASGDNGKPFVYHRPDSEASKAFVSMMEPVFPLD